MVHPLGDGGVAGQLFRAVLEKKSQFALGLGLTPASSVRATVQPVRAHGKPLSAYVCDAPPSDLNPNTTRKEGRKEFRLVAKEETATAKQLDSLSMATIRGASTS